MKAYDHKEIESKWQKEWKESKIYETPDKVEGKENFYTLFEFPYPSGNLHIGHWYAFAVPDIFARMKRMQGYNVLFPIGFDAFGLPAENAAIKRGLDPKKWTYENIAYMENQLHSMGGSFDWSRKVVTSDPEYYRWTQWLFLRFFEKGLAYKKNARVNWCPSCQTVLANEQVIDGKCERCGTEVVEKDLEQWFFKITDYAERLLSDLEPLNWPQAIKESQRNWIGKSEGSEIPFKIEFENNDKVGMLPVFTTRADTLFGATALVLSPEHQWVKLALDKNHTGVLKNADVVREYATQSSKKTEIERTNATKEKTGVKLEGVWAINPGSRERIPIFVADYVLANYGTGAVMSVPAHDERDFEFAQKYNLPVKHVVIPHRIDHKNPHIEGKELVFRKAVMAIVRNPKSGKILILKWKKQPWTTFVMGGIEEGEDPVVAARREIEEETGYKNVKLIRILGGPTQSDFYAAHKGVNRTAQTWSILFDLEDEEKNDISSEEAEIHDVTWMLPEEVTPEIMTHVEADIVLERIKAGPKPYIGEGVIINSMEFDQMKSEDAREQITLKFGEKVVKYKLRDWLLSRQRYWGAPIPIVYDPEGKPHRVPDEHLPWLLPTDVDFTPRGKSPLASSKELHQRTERIFGKGWTPEYDTMDTFVDSSWYFLRYTDPHNEKEFASRQKMDAWLPVEKYSGGAEHTTMHLLYSRFFHKALFDFGLVKDLEPYKERMNRGLILGPDGQKMSKSKGNVIDPDEQVERVGADTVRLYLAFIGPYNEVGQYPWDLGGIAGSRRFLERVWRLRDRVISQDDEKGDDLNSELISSRSRIETGINKTVKKVSDDIALFKFNTAISSMMILVNELDHTPHVSMGTFATLLKLLAPFAPHITEELWRSLGNKGSIHLEPWPVFDERKIVDDKANIAIQINGKVRGVIQIAAGAEEDEVKKEALEMPEVSKWLEGKEIKKVIFVPNKVLNIVI